MPVHPVTSNGKTIYEVGPRRKDNGKLSQLGEKHRAFLQEAWRHRFSCAGGGSGSAKTTMLAFAGAAKIMTCNGSWIMAGHRNKDLAYSVLIKPILDQLPILPIDPRIDKHAQNLTRGEIKIGLDPRNPCIIRWWGLDSSTGQIEALLASGEEYDLALVSQAEQIPEEAHWAINTRLRRMTGGHESRAIYDANPRKNWIYQMFVKGNIPSGASSEDYFFQNFTSYDNEFLPPEQLKALESMPALLRARMLMGEWEQTEGQIYEDFSVSRNVVQFNRIPFRETWRFSDYCDWGYWPDPFAHLISATDHDGNLFFLDEQELYKHSGQMAAEKLLTKRRQVATDVARMLEVPADRIDKRFDGWYGGTDFNRTESGLGRTIADQMISDPLDIEWGREYGVFIQPVKIQGSLKETREESRMSALARLMMVDKDHVNPITGEMGAPRLYVSDKCQRVIEQLETAEWEYNPNGSKKLNRSRVRNRFELELDATHHFDLEYTASLAAIRLNANAEPKKKTKSAEWLEIEKAMKGHNSRTINAI